MKALKKLLAVALTLSLPLAAIAQTPPSDQKPAEQTRAAEPSTPPTAPKPAAVPAADAVRVTPYGFVQLSGYWDANTFSAKDYPAQVARDQSPGGAFLMSARYSRFGVRLATDQQNFTGAKLGGVIEFDFKAGHLPSTFTTTCTGTPEVCTTTGSAPSTAWYNGVMRLRLANMTATWKTDVGQLAILAGQDYGLVNPLFGTSITHTADPIFWQAGNPWRRAPQIRAALTTSPELLGLNVAAAILSPQTADGAPDFGSGNRSRFPSLEGRVGMNSKFGPATVAAGVGYLYGKRRAPVTGATTTDVDGTILGVDVNVTSPFVDVKGEWFMQDGAGDTYNTIAAGAGGTPARGIESDGFWAQAILKPVPWVSLIGGYGREEADRGSLIDAGSSTAATTTVREESEQIHAAVIFNAGKSWKFGVEGVQTTTTYLDNTEREGRQVALSSQFVF